MAEKSLQQSVLAGKSGLPGVGVEKRRPKALYRGPLASLSMGFLRRLRNRIVAELDRRAVHPKSVQTQSKDDSDSMFPRNRKQRRAHLALAYNTRLAELLLISRARDEVKLERQLEKLEHVSVAPPVLKKNR